MVNDMDEDESETCFLSQNGRRNYLTKFKQTKENVWIPLSDTLCIVSETTATKRSLIKMRAKFWKV